MPVPLGEELEMGAVRPRYTSGTRRSGSGVNTKRREPSVPSRPRLLVHSDAGAAKHLSLLSKASAEPLQAQRSGMQTCSGATGRSSKSSTLTAARGHVSGKWVLHGMV